MGSRSMPRAGHSRAATFGRAILLCGCAACVNVTPELQVGVERGDDGGATVATVPDADTPKTLPSEAGGEAVRPEAGPEDAAPEAAAFGCPGDPDAGAVLGCPCPTPGEAVCAANSSDTLFCTAGQAVVGTVFLGLVWTATAAGPCEGTGPSDATVDDAPTSSSGGSGSSSGAASSSGSFSSSGGPGFGPPGDASICMSPSGCGTGSSSGASSGPPSDAAPPLPVLEDADMGDSAGSVGEDAAGD
jgi:hypothetical protein